MKARKMEYSELFGSISYESEEDGACRLLDYASDWKLASDEEKEQIRLCAAAPELLEALKNVLDELHKNRKLNVRKDYSLLIADSVARTAIHKAEGGKS